MPAHLGLENFPATHAERHTAGSESESALARYIADMWDANLTWADVDWLRSVSNLPVIIKGVLAPDDARLAVEHGAAAIIVSNHGGRQLDGVPAPISVLLPVMDAVAGRVEVLLDAVISDPGLWPRRALDEERVAEFVGLYAEQGPEALPPIEVVPDALIAQLKEGGRLVAVVGSVPMGKATLYRKVSGRVTGVPLFDAAAPLLPGFAKPAAFVF